MHVTWLRVALFTFFVGCQANYDYPGPKIDKFDGQLVSDGEPVQFEEGQKVVLRLIFHENGESYGIPIKPDGTFNIGWMPIGKYSANLEHTPPPTGDSSRGRGSRPQAHSIPNGFEVLEGQTEYQVELGKNWKK